MALQGLGGPGQRETTHAGIETSYRLILLQARGMIVLGCVILLVLEGIGCGVALRVAGWASWVRWMGGYGEWLLVPHGVWVIVSCVLGIWRFAAEIADPSYPTPRSASEAEKQREGPRWPWNGEGQRKGESAKEAAEKTWWVKAELRESGRHSLYLEFRVADANAWYRYCQAWRQQRQPAWSARGMARHFHLSRDEYEEITRSFAARRLLRVTKTYKDGRMEYEPNARGRAVIRAFATTPPGANGNGHQ